LESAALDVADGLSGHSCTLGPKSKIVARSERFELPTLRFEV
jgi:hypothetical protein